MADLQRRMTKSGGVRWDVHYRDDAKRHRKRSFERKSDAQPFARMVETDLLRGDWIDPKRSQESFETWARMWLGTFGGRKPKTRESYESVVNHHQYRHIWDDRFDRMDDYVRELNNTRVKKEA